MPFAKIQTGLRLEEGLYAKLRGLADIEGRSLNNLMEYIARQYVMDYEAKNGPIPLRND